LEQVANDVGLLLSPMEMPADRGHHLGAILRTTLPQRVGLDVVVEQFIGIELRAVARELNQTDLVSVGGDKVLRDARAMHGIPVDNEIDLAARLLPKPAHEVDEHRRAEGAVEHPKDELPPVGDRGDHATAKALARRADDRRLADRRVAGARDMVTAQPHFITPVDRGALVLCVARNGGVFALQPRRDGGIVGGIADAILQEVLQIAETHGLLSHEHFTVDGTLLDAWASQKRVQPKDPAARTPSDDGDPKNPTVNFRRQRRTNETHESTTDPDARLARKSSGTASIVGYLGSVLMDNRHGRIVATDVRAPGYDSERDAAQNLHARKSRSAIDDRTTRHDGYAISQQQRKLVEESFGWGKVVGGLRKRHHRGQRRVDFVFRFVHAAPPRT
jgi:hypothetical protein